MSHDAERTPGSTSLDPVPTDGTPGPGDPVPEGARSSLYVPKGLRTGPSLEDRAFIGHPGGLPWMLQVEMWERFSWFGMRAILLYFLVDTLANGGLGLSTNTGQVVVSAYGAAVCS
ncbi:hypothetical protein [Brachybacterium sillae]|uniref:hypothetical protein n=1 Tax=Brachybacterium sillae TaxID=2810536 RepID=UPI00217E0381|nr:hypothetical protein [Brachybacterium sillae]